jgi:hypothetical protein
VIDGCCGSDGSYVYDGSRDGYWAAAWYVSSRTLLEIGNFAHWIRCSCSYGRSFDDDGVAPNMAFVPMRGSRPTTTLSMDSIPSRHLHCFERTWFPSISLEAPHRPSARNSSRTQTTSDHSQIPQYSHIHPRNRSPLVHTLSLTLFI